MGTSLVILPNLKPTIFLPTLIREARKPICHILSKTLASLSQTADQMFNQKTTQFHKNIPSSITNCIVVTNCDPFVPPWHSVFPSVKWEDSTR